jgi:hypothetical protein
MEKTLSLFVGDDDVEEHVGLTELERIMKTSLTDPRFCTHLLKSRECKTGKCGIPGRCSLLRSFVIAASARRSIALRAASTAPSVILVCVAERSLRSQLDLRTEGCIFGFMTSCVLERLRRRWQVSRAPASVSVFCGPCPSFQALRREGTA